MAVALAAAFLLAGAVSAAASLIPFETAKERVDRLAPDGSAEEFTADLYLPIARRARFGGLALCAYGIGLWLARRRVTRFLENLRPDLGGAGRSAREAVETYWTTAPAWERWGIVIVLGAGLAVRLLYLGEPFRHDEAWTVDSFARPPFYRALTDLRIPNNHVFHSLLAGLSIRAFGQAEWVARVPALLAGWLTVAAVYFLFRRWVDGSVGLAAGALVAAQSAQIEYSALARGYTIVGLAFLILLAAVHDWPAHPRSRGRWWAFVLAGCIGMFTILSMSLPLAIAGAWFLIRAWELGARSVAAMRPLFTAAMAIGAGAVLFYLPAAVISGPGLYTGVRFNQPMAYSVVAEKGWQTAVSMASYWNEGWPAQFGMAVAGLAAFGIVLNRRVLGGWLPLLVTAIVICAGFAFLQRVVVFRRVYLFLSPLYLGTAAAAGVWLLARFRIPAPGPLLAASALAAGLGGVAVSRSVYYSDEIGNARDIREVTEFLRSRVRPTDHVSVTLISAMPAYHYFRRAGIPTAVLEPRRYEALRLFALEDKVAPHQFDADVEDKIMSDMELVMRIDGFDTERLPPAKLLLETRWNRVWLYEPLPRY